MESSLKLIEKAATPTSPDAVPFTPADPTGDGTVFHCALCGTAFTHGGQTCGSCPLGAACDLVSCPNCGYGFPRRSIVVDWVRRTWSRLVATRRG